MKVRLALWMQPENRFIIDLYSFLGSGCRGIDGIVRIIVIVRPAWQTHNTISVTTQLGLLYLLYAFMQTMQTCSHAAVMIMQTMQPCCNHVCRPKQKPCSAFMQHHAVGHADMLLQHWQHTACMQPHTDCICQTRESRQTLKPKPSIWLSSIEHNGHGRCVN